MWLTPRFHTAKKGNIFEKTMFFLKLSSLLHWNSIFVADLLYIGQKWA